MRNTIFAVSWTITIGAFACSVGLFDSASAEPVVFRFDAEQSGVPIPPPEGSLAAEAGTLPRISGKFGFESNAPLAAQAELPGRVAFGDYNTGFLFLDSMDIGRVPGNIHVQVTDGATNVNDPRLTIVDEVTLSTRAISTVTPIDAVTLRLRYLDAEQLQGVELPHALDSDDIEKVSLTFSTRIDGMSNRAKGETATGDLLGLVHFEVTVIERIE